MKVKKNANLHTALFEQAQAFYSNGKLAEAAAIYRQLLVNTTRTPC
jgi:hypothetical protein